MKPCALLAGLVLALVPASAAAARATARDDTAWLQARLDVGGSVFLPKLPHDECYATRGLWVSRDDTSITSDGACIVALGAGEKRLLDTARPVHAYAAFFLNHSKAREPVPVRIRISGVHIVVPARVHMSGITVSAHETTIDHVTIGGAPLTDVTIGDGRPGAGGMSERIAILDSQLTGAKHDAIVASGAIDLRVEGNTVAHAREAGLRVRAADRGQPTLDVRVVGNTIHDNAGPGIALELDPRNGAPVFASGFELSGNRVLRNGRAGILLAGGQDDSQGRLRLADNVVRANRGPGILARALRLDVTGEGNDLSGNAGGAAKGLHVGSSVSRSAGGRWSPSPATLATAGRDDTRWLQARLDARGGTMFLPKLPNGTCYATRGLWVSHDHTTITSDGACIVSLGPGPVRLRSSDGDPIASTGVFFVNRSSRRKPAPVDVTISNLRIVVPDGQAMYGVALFGHHVTVRGLDVAGAPIDDVLIGGRGNGNGYVGDVAVLDSTLRGAGRNAISAFGVFGLRVEGNTIEGVRDSPAGQPAAGIDLEPDDRSQPTLGIRIIRNVIRDNAGPGVLLSLETNFGPGIVATDIEVSGNTIVGNGAKRTPPVRAGLVISGGQDDGAGTLLLRDNAIHDNGGPGILTSQLRLVVTSIGNDVHDNEEP